MKRIQNLLRSDASANEDFYTTSRSLIATIGAVYMVWHFLATLTWPQVFSPSLWVSSLLMLLVVLLSLRLLRHYYPLAMSIWLLGLMGVILQAYGMYQQPEVMLFLVALPLMAIVCTGFVGTVLVQGVILAVILVLPEISLFPPLPYGYRLGILLVSIAGGFLGWSISSSLLSAIDSASFHFKEARRLLEETRRHRGEISRMLKDRNQVNYQLERLNQMLQAARSRAEEARIDRDRFVLAISHELRSPLNYIIGFSDLMINSPETYADLDEWPSGLYEDIHEIYRSSTHLLGLINDILDMGQIDAQQMSLLRERVGLDTVIEEVQEMAGKAFAQKGLYLKAEIEEDLPPVYIDRTRIRQVLLNLLNNSLRFTEQGGVRLRASCQEDVLRVEVTDTGAGIAQEDLGRVFQEFQQLGVENWRRREGSGLGLAISRRFVQLHGGKIWLESVLGQGTSFFFTLPVMQSAEEAEAPLARSVGSPEAHSAPDAEQKVEKLVLLHSPDPQLRKMARQWMEAYQVVAVGEAAQIPERVRQHLPQAVLVDLGQAAEPGLSARDLPYPLPVIGFLCPGGLGQNRNLPLGVTDYLVKPVSRQVLIEAVQRLEPQARRLLLVEDDPAMVRFVGQAFKSAEVGHLSEEECQVSSASTGKEALRLIEEQDFDAVLLDLQLPDMHGMEVLERMRRLPRPAPPVIVLSAMDLPQVFFHQGQVVLDVRLNRPLSSAELSAILKALVETIQPVFPKMGDLATLAPPASASV